MSIKIQLIVVIGALISMCVLLNMIRKKQLELRYTLSWLAVGTSVIILACFPGVLEWMAKFVGIASPVNMLFFFGFLFSLAIILVSNCINIKNVCSCKKIGARNSLTERRAREYGKIRGMR